MAKKDTIAALTKRGINEEVAMLLASKFNSMTEMSSAGVTGLMAAGLTEDAANTVIEAIGKRAVRSNSSKSKKKEDVAEEVKPEEITNKMEYTELEKMLIETGIRLEIEARRENGEDLSEEAVAELMSRFPIECRKYILIPHKTYLDIAKKLQVYVDSENPNDLPSLCEKFVIKANEMFKSHTMVEHESAGIMAAHSIGEPGTQMNLRTFHSSGDVTVMVTEGLPRFLEVVDATEKLSTPMMTIPLVGLAKSDEEQAKHIASKIGITVLNDIASVETDIDNLSLIIRPNAAKIAEKEITVEEIVENLEKIVKRLDKVKATDRVEAPSKAVDTPVAKPAGSTIKQEGLNIVITSNEFSFKKLLRIRDAVINAKIKGIDGIKRVHVRKVNDEYQLLTEGSNLREILEIDDIDKVHVTTNSIHEVAEVLGIEAARELIIREAHGVMKRAGLPVDVRHIMIVADTMVNDGVIRSIGRHGIAGKKSSVLAKAAFEITTAHLLHAAIVGESDKLEGVTENIIVGQPVALGTGEVELVYTPKKKGENE